MIFLGYAVWMRRQYLFDLVDCVPAIGEAPNDTLKCFTALALGGTMSDQVVDAALAKLEVGLGGNVRKLRATVL